MLWSRLHQVRQEQVNPWTKQISGWLRLETLGGAGEATDGDVDSGDGAQC